MWRVPALWGRVCRAICRPRAWPAVGRPRAAQGRGGSRPARPTYGCRTYPEGGPAACPGARTLSAAAEELVVVRWIWHVSGLEPDDLVLHEIARHPRALPAGSRLARQERWPAGMPPPTRPGPQYHQAVRPPRRAQAVDADPALPARTGRPLRCVNSGRVEAVHAVPSPRRGDRPADQPSRAQTSLGSLGLFFQRRCVVIGLCTTDRPAEEWPQLLRAGTKAETSPRPGRSK
ncbi:hypothetical protein BN159_1612 [Streptomyces davaonensis JCM 4913]|uniref:Uncharacterized protein n=1 Tax=Streptomyces davaonensis (strain DSM 101723 / JCM 4913 / KCC S-0913 / 768) TaxID=1214101 RepID=K4QT91_STRDJ|nr:hypothetical protein BN159_1612 [Streptomyces davaonensis JCM 4913]